LRLLFAALMLLTSAATRGSNSSEAVSIQTETASSISEAPNSSGIRGKVLNNQGSPIEGAAIGLECSQPPCPPIPELGVLTNAQGEFFWPIPAGEFSLTVHQNGKSSAPYKVIVESYKTVQVEMVLKAP
jgi:hypothetical protein